MCYYVATVK